MQTDVTLGDPPAVRPREMPRPPIRYVARLTERRLIVRREPLETADVRLAKVAQQIPERVLQRDLVRACVRTGVGAETLHDERVERVVGALVADAVQHDADDLALLDLLETERGETVARIDVVLTGQSSRAWANAPRRP